MELAVKIVRFFAWAALAVLALGFVIFAAFCGGLDRQK